MATGERTQQTRRPPGRPAPTAAGTTRRAGRDGGGGGVPARAPGRRRVRSAGPGAAGRSAAGRPALRGSPSSLTPVSTSVFAPVAGITAPGHPRRLFVVDQVGLLHDTRRQQAGRLARPRPPGAGRDRPGGRTVARRGRARLPGSRLRAGRPVDARTRTPPRPSTPPRPADFAVPRSTAPCARVLRPDHQSVVRRWHVSGARGARPTVERTRGNGRRVLAFEQPQFNHNGGDLDFGPDGMLYITSGDGGSGDDQDCQIDFDGRPTFGHPGQGNGQNLATPLGKILRIDPRRATSRRSYTVPVDNPFVATPGALGEIWAYGLRNPFRASFDGRTLWAGDVGQNHVEEVDRIVKGGNYGWRRREGGFGFAPAGFDTHGFASDGFVYARPARRGLDRPCRAVRPRRRDGRHRRSRLPGPGHAGTARPVRLRRHVAAAEQPARAPVRRRGVRAEGAAARHRRAPGRAAGRAADRLGRGRPP